MLPTVQAAASQIAPVAHVAQTGVHQTEAILFLILLQLTIIVLAGRAGSLAAQRIGQSAAVGEIVVGLLLGPSLFGALAPHAFDFVFRSAPPGPMQILSQIGLILLMFQIGLEFDFGHLGSARNRTTTVAVAIACIALPFALGLGLGYASAPILSPSAPPLAAALFVAVALSITALPILGRILIELDMTRHPLGVIAISAAAINDVVGWLLLALVTTLVSAAFEWRAFVLRIAGVIAFALVSLIVIRPLFRRYVGRHAPDLERTGQLDPTLLGVVLAAIFVSAMATYALGIFAIFGGFLMGVVLHQERAFVEAWRASVGRFVLVFFLPIFFTYTGLRTNVGGLDSAALWGWCALTIALATIGKYGGAWLAARACGFDANASHILGVLMNTRALMELIVINVGYDLGVISPNVFTMLVIMAIATTIVPMPLIRHALARAARRHGKTMREAR
ncbi:cation:proton antiporter [Pararobbsia silviterrae]|uniref:cation:proton antiporter n=1 Tax=Pararobbsia silviterrae TaxID=1792498 RepID=UPI00140CA353|nr:cation:proton antiporter [Pararobbsia silviterrae]